MAPSTSKTTKPSFPTWDELVAEAAVESGADSGDFRDSYIIPMGDAEDDVVIERFDGDRYLKIIDAQRRGDAVAIMEGLFPDKTVRERVRIKMRGAPFEIVDVLGNKVIRYFYGLSIQREEQSGNSPAS